MSLLNHSHFEKAAFVDIGQRCEERHLVILQRASLSAADGYKYEARLVDISYFGCRLEFDQELLAGTQLQLRFFKRDPIGGKIVWCKDGLAGCHFDASIDKSLLRALTLRSA